MRENKDLAALRVDRTEEVRMGKILALRQAIAMGTYRVAATDVAAKMIEYALQGS